MRRRPHVHLAVVLAAALAGAAAAAPAAVFAGTAAAGETSGDSPRPPSRRAHAFYYPWYANPAADGRWGHWDHQVLLREGGGRRHEPPGDIGAPFYPALGLYSSSSAADLAAHRRQLREAGVGVIATSWWGRGSQEDRAVPGLLEAAREGGLEVCFHLEPYAGRSASSVREDLAYIAERYGASPAFHRHEAAGGAPGMPLVYVYDSYLIPAAEWARVLKPGGDLTVRGTRGDAVLLALWVKADDGAFVLEGGFDGFYTYFATDGFTHGSTPRNWLELGRWAREHGKLFSPSVGPGYDDAPIRPWNAANRRDRDGGAYYDRMFQAALQAQPPLVSITSFNEWHEGTQIEPAVPKEAAGRTYLDYWPLEPDGYLRRTRRWVDLLEDGLVMTVEGPASARALGKTLPHEHVLCDFRGARVEGKEPPEREDVVALMLPRLEEARRRGFQGFFDCTPAGIGRNVEVLAELARRTGLRIATNTGYYGAAGDKFLPEHAFGEPAGALADRWTAEWRDGIDGTGVRPGFIKIGVDPGPLSDVDRKLARAAARCHLSTGLTIACHTGEARAALEVLEAVTAEGVDPSALIVVHADGIDDEAVHGRLADAGAWVEYDGVGARPTEAHVRWIGAMVRCGSAGRLLLSHDAGWYTAGEPGGGAAGVRPFTALEDQLLPALRAAGIEEGTLRRIVEENPARAFRVEIRRRGERPARRP